MSKETTDPVDTTVVPDVDDTIMESLKSKGYKVLTQDEIDAIIARRIDTERKKWSPIQKTLEQTQTELTEAKKKLKEIGDVGKSADELQADRQVEWERINRENLNSIEAIKKEKETIETTAMMVARDRRIDELLDNSSNAKYSRNCLLADIPSITADLHGKLTVKDSAGIVHEGKDAEDLVKKWWDANGSSFRKAGIAGPSTGDATKPITPNNNYTYGVGGSLTSRLIKAERFKEQQKKRR
jgi:hypothetical protein